MPIYGSNITPRFPVADIPHPSSIISAQAASNLIIGHPLCDKNLLKDTDGIASLSTMPSLPNLEDFLGASGLSSVPEKLDPEAMFSGIPTFSGLPEMFGIPDINDIDWEKEAKAAADDVLNKLNISNPLDDLCAQVQGAGADLDEQLGKIPDISGRDINEQIPNIDIPKFTDIVDVPEVGDIF